MPQADSQGGGMGMQTFGGGGVMGGIGSIAAGMGMSLFNDTRQIDMEYKLQKLAMKNQKEMTDYNMKKQLEMWEATNYKAQVEQMKKAGLGVGLMYGMKGGGGTTAAVNAGQVAGGNAPKGGGEIMGTMGMGMNLALISAQKDLMKAQAEKAQAEANKTAGADTANTNQNTETGKAVMNKTNTETAFLNQTFKDRAEQINNDMRIALERVNQEGYRTSVAGETWRAEVKRIKAQAIGAVLDNLLTAAQTEYTGAQSANAKADAHLKGMQEKMIISNIAKNDTEVAKLINDMALGWKGMDLQEKRTKIEVLGNILKEKYNNDPIRRWWDREEIMKQIDQLMDETKRW